MSENTTTETTQDERPTLTLTDLRLMTQVIESGLERKAWKVEELSTVGGLYDRISSFLNAANAAQQAQSNPDADEQQ
jgi:hypothetical protein